MNLSENNFSKTHILIRDRITDELLSVPLFTYESHNGLFDVGICRGQRIYRVDSRQWSNLICDIKPIHYAIESHFNLD
jgi:hypothetical protein